MDRAGDEFLAGARFARDQDRLVLKGGLGDLLGRRNILLWVLALSTLGSAISSVTKELEWLIFGRTLLA